MNEKEAQELVEKIMHCDEVIHLQQLSVPWKRPTDPIFHFLRDPNGNEGMDNTTIEPSQHGNSVGHDQSAMMDNSEMKETQGRSRSELDENESVNNGGSNHDMMRDKYERIKNVFRMLIEEAPYLIDDKAFEKCEGKTLKEQFSIQIDGIRKALGIDQMEDVDLLVDCFYNFENKLKEKEAEVDKEELEMIAELGEEQFADDNPPERITKKGTENTGGPKTVEKGGKPSTNDAIETPRSEEEVDPNTLDLNPDNVCAALNDFE